MIELSIAKTKMCMDANPPLFLKDLDESLENEGLLKRIKQFS